jgi:hypothetical protein
MKVPSLFVATLAAASLTGAHPVAPTEHQALASLQSRNTDGKDIYKYHQGNATIEGDDTEIYKHADDGTDIYKRADNGIEIFKRTDDGTNIFKRADDGTEIYRRVNDGTEIFKE